MRNTYFNFKKAYFICLYEFCMKRKLLTYTLLFLKFTLIFLGIIYNVMIVISCQILPYLVLRNRGQFALKRQNFKVGQNTWGMSKKVNTILN